MPVSLLNNIYLKDIPQKALQTCPLCGQFQTIMVRGLVPDIESNELKIAYDKGYSFCNCRNIFFTAWSNIDQTIYDSSYYAKYKTDLVKEIATFEIKKFYEVFKKYNPNISSFFEIGCIHDHALDHMRSRDLTTFGVDITEHDSNHDIMTCNFEKLNHEEISTKFDIIYASHIFEHFKDVKAQLLKCKQFMHKDSQLFIAMPDTFFIDWNGTNYLEWHWVVNEHHIMWSMDSFIDYCEELGLTCIYSERSSELFKKTSDNNELFWQKDFKTIFKVKND